MIRELQIIFQQACFSAIRYPKLIGGNLDSTQFNVVDQDTQGNTIIGGSTSDNEVSQLSGQKPLVVFISNGGDFQWTMIFNILSYFSVSDITFRYSSSTRIALSFQTTASSTDPFNIMVLTSTGTVFGFYTLTSLTKSFIPATCLKYKSTGLVYLAMQPEGTQYFQIMRFDPDSVAINFYKKWPQSETQANTVDYDTSNSYHYYGGILKDSGGTFYTSVVTVETSGNAKQIFTIRKSTATQQFSVKRIEYFQDTAAGTKCLAVCAEDGQDAMIMKLNVNSGYTLDSPGQSTLINGYTQCIQVSAKNCMTIRYLVGANNAQIKLGEADFSSSQYRYKDVNYYTSDANNQIFHSWMDSTQVIYVGTIKAFTNEAATTTTFTQNIGWLMNSDPSYSEITITNALSTPSSMSTETLTYSTLSNSFQSITDTIGKVSKQFTSAIISIVPQIVTPSVMTIITSTIADQQYAIGNEAMTFTIPAFTLQQTCSDVVFQYSSDVSALSAFVQFSASTRFYTVYTNSKSYAGVYEIKMIGKINNNQSAEHQYNYLHYNLYFNKNKPNFQFKFLHYHQFNENFKNLNQFIKTQYFATQQFSIQINHNCNNDIITPSAILASYDYFIELGTAQYKFTLSWTHLMSYCGSITYSVVNQANDQTADSIFYISSYYFYVSTSISSKINTYNLRIIGGTAYKSVRQDFIVIIKTDCPNVVITAQNIIDKTYSLGSSRQTFSFINWSLSKPGCGPISYTLLIDNAAKPSWVQFDTTTRTISYETSDTQAIVANQIIYLNESPVKRLTLPSITQSSSTISCGLVTQEVTDASNQPLDPAIFTYHQTNNSIAIFTSDKANFISSPFSVKVINHLQDYPAIVLIQNFLVTLEIDCQFEQLTSSADISLNYIVYDKQWLNLSDSIKSNLSPHCGTITQYTCKNQISSSDCVNDDLILFNSTTGSLRIYTENKNLIGTHQYLITGYLNNKQAIQKVIVTVIKDCRSAVITKSALPALTYDISNGTNNYITDVIWTNDMINQCPMSYQLIDQDTTLTSIHDSQQYSIIVTGFAHSTVSSSETLSLTITNLCPSSQITAQPIQDQDYITSNPVKIIQFDSWISSISYCTQFTYTAAYNDTQSIPNFITFNPIAKTFSIQTMQISDIGEYQIKVKGQIGNGNFQEASFTLSVILSCSQNVISVANFGIPDQVQYNITQSEMVLQFNEFTDMSNLSCGPMSYSASYNNQQNFPYLDVIQFDSILRQFKIQTKNPQLNNTLITIQVKAFIGVSIKIVQFQVTLLYLCHVDQLIPLKLNGQSSGDYMIEFDEFIKNENCSYPVIYSLQIKGFNSNATFINGSEINQRKIKVNLENKQEAYNPDYVLEIQGIVQNINDQVKSVLSIPLKLIAINNNPPKYALPLQNIKLSAGESQDLVFPGLLDMDGDESRIIQVNMGQAAKFISGSYPNYKIQTSPSSFGTYKISVTVEDINPNPKQQTYSFNIQIEKKVQQQQQQTQDIQENQAQDNIQNSTSSSNETDNENSTETSVILNNQYASANSPSSFSQAAQNKIKDSKKSFKTLIALISKISNEGSATIQFSSEIIIPKNYNSFDHKILLVRIKDGEGKISQDLNYTWKITEFKEKSLTLQLLFNEPKLVSAKDQHKLSIGFKGNNYFRDSASNQAISYLYETNRLIPRQMFKDAATKALQAVGGSVSTGVGSVVYGIFAVNLLLNSIFDFSLYNPKDIGQLLFSVQYKTTSDFFAAIFSKFLLAIMLILPFAVWFIAFIFRHKLMNQNIKDRIGTIYNQI
ncbi:cadg domain containing protein [Stylonychia lemnae]|uniref:Cadg domain containing protein n=1 Tax=Stylonychia lemnae TaxID=5949 RepID=A0A077ZN09_STYLE|nr:cadg domain containing protein [Stylonychia lemnae]|eukprot:CDW71352.1 cadg domain containing protein [Stylonychia lemnae]